MAAVSRAKPWASSSRALPQPSECLYINWSSPSHSPPTNQGKQSTTKHLQVATYEYSSSSDMLKFSGRSNQSFPWNRTKRIRRFESTGQLIVVKPTKEKNPVLSKPSERNEKNNWLMDSCWRLIWRPVVIVAKIWIWYEWTSNEPLMNL